MEAPGANRDAEDSISSGILESEDKKLDAILEWKSDEEKEAVQND